MNLDIFKTAYFFTRIGPPSTQNQSTMSLKLHCFETAVQICLRACLHEGGGPQVGVVTCGGLPHLACKRDHIKMRDCMDRRVTPPTWGPPLPCKQALTQGHVLTNLDLWRLNRIKLLIKVPVLNKCVNHFCP